jgi:tRNA dimethylallyltransferase
MSNESPLDSAEGKESGPPAIFLMGPTASGKTALSIDIAEAFGCEIISVDSALVYRQLDIGTAKPTVEEMSGIPHHLIDIIEPTETFSTGAFREQALQLMKEITERGKLPLLVGGTMLYFNALFNGLAKLPSANPQIRAEIELEALEKGWLVLHRQLAEVDPAAAKRIHPNDPQRIQRALEVYRIVGKSLTQLCEEAAVEPIPYRQIRMVLAPAERKLLHEKIALRFHKMLAQGFLDEVKKLRSRGDLDKAMPSMRAVGYRQAWEHLEGDYGYDELVEKGIIATRQLAKRQFTWLRKQSTASHYQSEDPELLSHVLSDLKKQLVR